MPERCTSCTDRARYEHGVGQEVQVERGPGGVDDGPNNDGDGWLRGWD